MSATATEAELQRRLDPNARRDGFSQRFLKSVPRVVCADGLSMSVQAGYGLYSEPRDNDGPFRKVEVGFPSAKVDAFMEYVDGGVATDPTNTVYGFVPLATVASVVDEHGGFAAAKPAA